MKTIVSLDGVEKPVGAISKIVLPVNDFQVGDYLERVDQAGQILNIALVTSVENGVEIEIVA